MSKGRLVDTNLIVRYFISSPGVEIGDTVIHLDALDRHRKTKVHFVDCLIAATFAEVHVENH